MKSITPSGASCRRAPSSLAFCRRAIALRAQRGVSLIEILITLLVLAVGLLGLAALQGFSLQAGQVSYYRTQATNVGYEVVDFARANRSRITQGVLQNIAEDLSGRHLPAGDATVTYAPTNGDISVLVSWLDDRTAETQETASFTLESRI